MRRLLLKLRLLISPVTRLFSPGWGTCYCCHLPWSIVKGHETPYRYDKQEDCKSWIFPLCTFCWKFLKTPERRRPYYITLLSSWESQGCPVSDTKRQEILTAVEEGR